MVLLTLLKRLFGLQFYVRSNSRYVGGLVSTVDLLEYGFAGPSFDSRGIAAIRRQAEILTQKLAPGYKLFTNLSDCSLESPMRMWLPRVDFRTSRGMREDIWGDTTVSPARAGSNILEYGRLSELSLDLQYFKNVDFPRLRADCRLLRHGGH